MNQITHGVMPGLATPIEKAPGACDTESFDTNTFNLNSATSLTTEQEFLAAIVAAGLTPPYEIIADGEIHRFSTSGRVDDDAGWYAFRDDVVAGGTFGCWRSDQMLHWCSKSTGEMTQAELVLYQDRVQSQRVLRESEKAQRQASAAVLAASSFDAATPCINHPYLTTKGVQAYDIRQAGDNLLIPLYDLTGTLHSLQTITPDGGKRFLTGGRVKGCFHGLMGSAGVLLICEGYATGASLHEATGYQVAVAFNAGNLEVVALDLRVKFPDVKIVIAADDDYQTEGNPGMTKARSAAAVVGGYLAVPDFGADRPAKATDFNDLHQLLGLDAVKRCIDAALSSVPAIASSAVPTIHLGVAGSPFPSMDKRPCYLVLDDWHKSSEADHRPGVYYCGIKVNRKGEIEGALDDWICSPMHIDAVTFDGQSNNFGILLRFKPTVGEWREWAMPMELLAGDGTQLRAELLAMGVRLDPYKAKQQLPHYLQSEMPKRRIHCALQVGWCGDSFVLPDAVIGPKAADVIFQSGERGHEEHTQAGTLAGWQQDIAAKAVGNPLLLLVVSASFAGPLLQRCNAEGGGFHIVGDSSTGKTTLIEAACATWGGPGFKRSWRATANGMEGAAAMFNDCLLALDEISECDPKEVGAIIYALGNGRGKQRANRSGSAQGVTRWRCFVISSGERTIATTMQEGGHRVKAGQSMRLLDIPAAQTFGAWDNLHDASSPAAFSDAIKRAAAQHHGQAGRAFLAKLTFDTSDFCAMLEDVKAAPIFATDGTEGQDKRAAARFALIGLAGELATSYGLTDWPVGAAIEAAGHAFKLWQSTRGKGNDERRQILQRVSGFIERHGDGRFSDADSTDEMQVRDRAGWWRDTNGAREYLFTADGMHEATKGIDFKRALDVLQEAAALPAPGANGERAKFIRIAGRGVKLYPIDPDKLTGGEHGA